MDPRSLSKRLSNWIRDKVREANGKGCIIGLSGGVDSAVAAALSKMAFPEATLGLIMPCHSNPEDAEDAVLVAEKFDIPTKLVDLSPIFDSFIEYLREVDPDVEPKGLAVANIKPRLRMITLYHFAAKYNRLVIGTGNRSELTIGYFTKYGDGGVDLLPLGSLVKTQVRELARYLGVPAKVIEKPPTAGLWEGQTDEGEMGMSYADLDRFILTGEGRPEVIAKVKDMNARSEHKRRLPLIPEITSE